LIAKDELNRVQSCCPYSGQLFLFAPFKDLNSEVTGSNDALFEIYQRCGPYLLITNDFVISFVSFLPLEQLLDLQGRRGSGQHITSKINTNSNLVNKNIHAVVRGHYEH